MSEFIPKFLSNAELQLVKELTVQAIDNGLAGRYNDELTRRIANIKSNSDDLAAKADEDGVVGSITLDSLLSGNESRVRYLEEARAAEYGFVFDIEPSNLAQSVIMHKIKGNKRLIFNSSTIQLGLVRGFAGEGKPNDGFIIDDLTFAVQSAERMAQTSPRD